MGCYLAPKVRILLLQYKSWQCCENNLILLPSGIMLLCICVFRSTVISVEWAFVWHPWPSCFFCFSLPDQNVKGNLGAFWNQSKIILETIWKRAECYYGQNPDNKAKQIRGRVYCFFEVFFFCLGRPFVWHPWPSCFFIFGCLTRMLRTTWSNMYTQIMRNQ